MNCPDCSAPMDLVFKGSVTQLLNGTRMSYLKIVEPYYITPTDSMYALLGSGVHKLLAEHGHQGALQEKQLQDEINSGTFDYYYEEDGVAVLTDYKVWGSWAVRRILDPSEDHIDAEMQVNRYRTLLEAAGHRVDRMQLQIAVRDSGLAIAKQRGIDKPVYVIPIKFIVDLDVISYFQVKAIALQESLASKQLPQPCDERERWQGNRCKSYCDVWQSCEIGRSKHVQVSAKAL